MAVSAPGVVVTGDPTAGTITNSGALNVVALASGGTYATPGATARADPLVGASSNATATGIRVDGGVSNLTITNSGSINVDAITANGDLVTDPKSPGGVATAYGIRVEGNGARHAAPATSSPSTTRATSSSVSRAMAGRHGPAGSAIDVSALREPTVINLLGGAERSGEHLRQHRASRSWHGHGCGWRCDQRGER